MLKDRGYHIGDYDLNMELFNFRQKHGDNMKREDLTICKAKRTSSSDQVFSCSMLAICC